ncbi:MAG: D-glycero-beta-D-manno-heptose 1-phosphate adenylyltransferase [bacterium]
MGQVVELDSLLEIINKLKKEKKIIVTTNGCFDIIHIGHIRYLREAKALGDILIVGLNTDRSVKNLKGPTRPINQEKNRAEVLASIISVDYTVLFDEDTPVELLSKIKPNIHVKGGDYNLKNLPEAETVQKTGGKVVFIPLIEGESTTNIIKLLEL